MKTFRLIAFLMFWVFMIGIYAGFIYSLSMMTDVTTLTFFSDFLDESVIVYVTAALATNNEIFRLCLIPVIVSLILYFFGFKNRRLGIFRYGVSLLIGGFGFYTFLLCRLEMIDINAVYAVTDTAWPAEFPFTAEMLGYIEPGNFFVGSGPMLYSILMGVCALFMVVTSVGFVVSIKEKLHEKT